MENASKALIIAGAILISILLISVGVLIMNSMDPMKDAAGKQADSMAIQTFNAQFTAYEGEGKTASQIRSLISAYNASLGAYPENTLTLDGAVTSSTDINSRAKYNVSLGYDNDTGFVNKITINVATATK